MGPIKAEYLERELKRWMRPDARNFIRPAGRRYVKPGSDAESAFALYERKWRIDQLRDWRGRFADEGGGGEPENDGADRGPIRIAARIPASRRAECELQQRQDTFICNTIGTRSCWAQAAFRFSQCLKGGYVPPFYH